MFVKYLFVSIYTPFPVEWKNPARRDPYADVEIGRNLWPSLACTAKIVQVVPLGVNNVVLHLMNSIVNNVVEP